MSNSKTCDACGADLRGGTSIGGTILCRACAPLVEDEIASIRAAGKPVSAARISAKMRKATLHDYILRDIPPELWERVQAVAARRGQTARELIMTAIRSAVAPR